MTKLLLLVALIACARWGQTQLTPNAKGATVRPDPCAPIGKTAKGELVYSMKCDNLPAPPAPPPQAEVREAVPPPEPEVRRTGLFGWSYDRRKPDERSADGPDPVAPRKGEAYWPSFARNSRQRRH